MSLEKSGYDELGVISDRSKESREARTDAHTDRCAHERRFLGLTATAGRRVIVGEGFPPTVLGGIADTRVAVITTEEHKQRGLWPRGAVAPLSPSTSRTPTCVPPWSARRQNDGHPKHQSVSNFGGSSRGHPRVWLQTKNSRAQIQLPSSTGLSITSQIPIAFLLTTPTKEF